MEALALVAPGRPLREGLDRVVQANRGTLVVVGDDPGVLSICTGGFLLDAEFSPQRLSELAKMDGAIILAPDASRIARANVHLVPKASIPTSETGTRHRTAERVARSLDVPVITVSGSMSTISVYRSESKHVLQRTSRLIDRAGQALSTLQRFRNRFDLAVVALSTLEVEDAVSVRDVVAVLQPGEMVLRIADEIEGYLVELGDDGRLTHLQLQELSSGVETTVHLVLGDYVSAGTGATRAPAGQSAVHEDGGRAQGDGGRTQGHGVRAQRDGRLVQEDGEAAVLTRAERDELTARAAAALRQLSGDDLVDGAIVAAALGLGAGPEGLDHGVEPRGYRLLYRLPRVSDVIIDRIVARFADLPGVLAASLSDLEKVGGVGASKARAVKDGLARIVESSILDHYD
jgi:diadenylate cyclase